MLAIVHPDRQEERQSPETTDAPAVPPPVERHGYAPPASRRVVALVGTGIVYALVAAGFFLTISVTIVRPTAPPALTVIALEPLASPPETPPKPKVAPKPVKKKEKQPEAPRVQPVERPIIPLPAISHPPPAPADPAPREPETAAPKTAPAPPAPQVSSNAPDTWQGRVLARLGEFRRYPAGAQRRREQGVPYIRIVMDRSGRVLSSRLERSSGFPDLDREAVKLPERAEPLPKPPADVTGDTIELVVPVQFFLR